MKSFMVGAVLVTGTASSPDADRKFDDFLKKFGRNYATNDERELRRSIFNQNLALIVAENAKGKSYQLGVTSFADLTVEEWRSQYLTGFVMPNPSRNVSLRAFRAAAGFMAPDSVDWVAQGAVTPVKNQAHCGSCWTFSTTGALEGASFIAGRGLTSLSEQNILDCDKGGNKCNGGSMDQAFGWVAANGLCSEADDSYKCADSSLKECTSSMCPTSCTQVLQPGDVIDHTDVDQTEEALEAAVAQQPVSVAIEADDAVFMHYTGGVLTDDACGEKLDHGVLAVGYGVDNGVKYWKVKNSWGESWGEDGYIRIEKGQTTEGGECGIRKLASFPTVASAKHEIIV